MHPYADAPKLADEPLVDPRDVLGSRGAPVEVEIGPGRGGFMLERLEAFREIWMLGLEIRLKWASLVDQKLAARGYGNRARVLAHDAKEAFSRFPDDCLSAVFVNFPDPWWKKRHEKRLVVNSEMLRLVARTLLPGGELFVQTDVEERARRSEALVLADGSFEPAGAIAWVSEQPYGARSPRERRALLDGLPIYRLRYRRRGPPLVAVPVQSAELHP